MNQLVARGIVLARTNYGEADRIIRLLTPDAGKISLMARGVRKPKSKMAGGIELFSVTDLTYIRGRGDLGTLVSARLDTHYGNIVKHIERVQLGYDLIKMIDRATEDEPEPEYFTLLQDAFAALNEAAVGVELIRFWFGAQLLALGGNAPNLLTDPDGQPLIAGQHYNFDLDSMSFIDHSAGRYSTDHIKFLRVTFAGNAPRILQQVSGVSELVAVTLPLVNLWQQHYIT